MIYKVEAALPFWDPPDDASEQLVEAWEIFQSQILEHWDERRRYISNFARLASRRVRRLEEPCPVVAPKVNELVRALASDPTPAEREAIGERPRLGVRWPPEGYEELLPGRISRPSTERPPPTGPPARDLAAVAAADISPSGMTGVAAGRLRGGEVEFLEAAGFADEEEQEPLTPDAAFRLPAFTEVVISALAAELAQEGAIDLQAPISSYLTDLDDGLGAISLQDLLSHRSGLDDANPGGAIWSEILDALDDRAVFTDPGAVFSYSRYDYPLAVRTLEAAVGEDLAAMVRERVFEPLGMESTSLGQAFHGLPVTETTVPALLRFWSARLNGQLGGLPSLPADSTSAPLRDGRGRLFDGGVWGDWVAGQRRFSMMCAAGSAGDAAGVQIFPDSALILVFWSRTRTPYRLWPSLSANFLLETLGSDLGVGEDILGPKGVRGDAEFAVGPRPCREPRWSSERIGDPGSRVASDEWVGRFANGDRIFQLQSREGALWAQDGTGLELEVRHYDRDTYFAAMGDRPFWPFRLVRDHLDRRYAVLGDRAYIHEEDRSGV
jgi:CubicO group peptidase (beta-lactamase class C family)